MIPRKKKITSVNKKIKNAQPNVYKGIKFRSKLETYTYKKLEEAHIDAEYEMHRFELIPAFTFCGKKIRAMTYLPDFVGDNFIIECKGFGNDAWPLREKLFKYFLYLHNDKRMFFVLKNHKDVDKCVEQLKNIICENNCDK